MSDKLKVFYISPEVSPFAKSGWIEKKHKGSWVHGSEVQGSAPPPAKKTAGLIEKENLFLTGSTGWTG